MTRRGSFPKSVKRLAWERSLIKCEAVGLIYGLEPKSAKREQTCCVCGSAFQRAYNISAKRSQRPQYCGPKCRKIAAGKNAAERFESRFNSKVAVRSPAECWEWKGRVNGNGYGVFDFNGRPLIASRVSYELAHGAIPDGLFVCHSCDNPICVNPSHLWVGSGSDNMRDCAQKGRINTKTRRGTESNTSKLTEDDVREIRASSATRAELAKKYNVSANAIRLIQKRVNWGWLDA